MADIPPSPPLTARDLFRERDYRFFWCSRWAGTFASQIQSVAMGWLMYSLARQTRSVEESAFLVGMIGLAAFVPVFLLTLTAGETADRHDRKRIMLICLAVEALSSGVLAGAVLTGRTTVPLLLGVAVVFGAARAFFSPANTALGPMLVPRALLPRAIAWNSLAFQSAAIAGPALAGVLIAGSSAKAFIVVTGLYAVSATSVLMIRRSGQPMVQPGSRWTLVKEGVAYVWRQKVIFGAISLDLFAVLLGGATALLPVFARDVLHVGAEGFGILRAAPALGATVIGAWMAIRPVRAKAGLVMFGGVAMFGMATVIFALSRNLWLSAAAMALLGGADMLSVFIRQTLIQIVTPDNMRGRVAAVSAVFIGASNELGEFESGVVARFLGPVGAALFGGIGAIMVTGIWAKLFPDLRKADRLE